MVEIDRNEMVVLDRDECFHRLGTVGVGRIAIVVDGRPAIFPVNYAVLNQAVYFLSAPGSKLAAAANGDVVAFEVDHQDALEHSGWDVTVVGPARIVPEAEVEPVWRLKLGRWVGGGPTSQIRIEAEEVSGREIGRPGPGIHSSSRASRSGGSITPLRAFGP